MIYNTPLQQQQQQQQYAVHLGVCPTHACTRVAAAFTYLCRGGAGACVGIPHTFVCLGCPLVCVCGVIERHTLCWFPPDLSFLDGLLWVCSFGLCCSRPVAFVCVCHNCLLSLCVCERYNVCARCTHGFVSHCVRVACLQLPLRHHINNIKPYPLVVSEGEEKSCCVHIWLRVWQP